MLMAMQMQSGNAEASEKIHGGGGGEGLQQQPQQQGRGQPQWWLNHQQPPQSLVQMDERDGFISWLRGEFAAANAIIDALCHHLRVVGEPGEYDGVIGYVQQRRCNWNPVLHMQQYFSVNEVVYALQQVGFRKNQQHPQQRGFEGSGKVGKEYSHRRGGGGRGAQRWDGGFREGKDGHQGQNFGNFDSVPQHKEMNGNQNLENGEGKVKNGKVEEIKESFVKPEVDSSVESTGSRKAASTGSGNVETGTHSEGIPHKKQNHTAIPKAFTVNEIFDGKTVNVVDGLKLFEELFDRSEVSKLVTLVNELRVAGRRGQFQGQTFVVSKRPIKGHGREMIQLGLPIADAPLEDDVAAGTSKDWKFEPIPSLFEDVIGRLITMEIISEKPDCCKIDLFNEGDYSQPQFWPTWYAKPVCLLFLTEFDMTFGKTIVMERPGDYRGSLKLSFTPGSMLSLEGKSFDFSKHAIPSTSKQRIVVTFVKSLPKKVMSSDAQRVPSGAAQPPSQWVPPPSRSPNHSRHPGPKHYGPVPTSSVLPAPGARPTLPAPNGIQTIFVPAAVAPPMPFPAQVPLPPVSGAWAAAPPRHSAPRLPVPGTGVFLPGTGNSANQSSTISPRNENANVEALSGQESQEMNSDVENASSMGTNDEKAQPEECNGTTDGINSQGSVAKESEEPVGAVSS